MASAQARGVPVIAARQLLEWLDSRHSSSFRSLPWSGSVLSFPVDIAGGARGLQAMLPRTTVAAGTLTTIAVNGNPVASTTETITEIGYPVFLVEAGSYRATYTP